MQYLLDFMLVVYGFKTDKTCNYGKLFIPHTVENFCIYQSVLAQIIYFKEIDVVFSGLCLVVWSFRMTIYLDCDNSLTC